jgi:tRNA(fMet)-specific endonuclease VapC
VLPFDQRAAERFAELKAQAQRLGRITSDFDLAIAATAVANDLKLATLNFKHFAKLSMVHAEDWA